MSRHLLGCTMHNYSISLLFYFILKQNQAHYRYFAQLNVGLHVAISFALLGDTISKLYVHNVMPPNCWLTDKLPPRKQWLKGGIFPLIQKIIPLILLADRETLVWWYKFLFPEYIFSDPSPRVSRFIFFFYVKPYRFWVNTAKDQSDIRKWCGVYINAVSSCVIFYV